MKEKELLATAVIVMKYAVQKMILSGKCSKLYKDNECNFYSFSAKDVSEVLVIEKDDKTEEIVFTLKNGHSFNENGAPLKHKEIDALKATSVAVQASSQKGES